MKIFQPGRMLCEEVHILPVFFRFFLIFVFVVAVIVIICSIKFKNRTKYIHRLCAIGCTLLVLISWVQFENITYGWTGCPSDLFSPPFSYLVRIGIDNDEVIHVYKPDKLLTFPFILKWLWGDVSLVDIFGDYNEEDRRMFRSSIEHEKQYYESKGYFVKIEDWKPEFEIFFDLDADVNISIPDKNSPITLPTPNH
jgi:hypothetical protein